MSMYQEIKDTLDSPGMKHIIRAFRNAAKGYWRMTLTCTPEQLPHLQANIKAIKHTMPDTLNRMMNKHLKENEKRVFDFDEYAKTIRNKVQEEFDPASQIKIMARQEGGENIEVAVPIGYDPSVSCVKEGAQRFYAILPDGRVFPIIQFPFGVIYDGICRQCGLSAWR